MKVSRKAEKQSRTLSVLSKALTSCDYFICKITKARGDLGSLYVFSTENILA